MKAGARPPSSAPTVGEPLRAAGNGALELSRVVRVLSSLPELELRVRWLEDDVSRRSDASAAALFDALCEEAGRGDPGASAALLPVALYFASRGDDPRRAELRAIAEQQRLLGLERLLRTGPDLPEPIGAGREPAVPDYGAGRELTVGERRSLARRPTRAELEKLLGDPHPLVLSQIFLCPKLTEADVVRVATRRPLRAETISVLTKSTRWMNRRRVRLSLLLNPGCPHHVSVPLVHTCLRDELSLVVESTPLPGTLRTVAHELLTKRPPWGEPYSTLQ